MVIDALHDFTGVSANITYNNIYAQQDQTITN